MVNKRGLSMPELLEDIIMDAYKKHIREELNGIDVLNLLKKEEVV
jgi:hypothetical protein